MAFEPLILWYEWEGLIVVVHLRGGKKKQESEEAFVMGVIILANVSDFTFAS